MMPKTFNFIVQGYDGREPLAVGPFKNSINDYKMIDVAEVHVNAGDATEAVRYAKSLIKKKFYRVAKIVENVEHTHLDPWKNFPWDKMKKLLK